MAELNLQTKTVETEVYVASAQKNLIEERMKLCAYLWANGFKVGLIILLKEKTICCFFFRFIGRNGVKT